MLKGVDVLIEAIALLAREGASVERSPLSAKAPTVRPSKPRSRAHGLGGCVRFVGAKPARAAFALGRLLVVPSRAESLPYIVLEAAAAGVPLIATECRRHSRDFRPRRRRPRPARRSWRARPRHRRGAQGPRPRADAAARLQARVRAAFSVDTMTDGVLAAYRAALACGMVKQSSANFSRCLSIS